MPANHNQVFDIVPAQQNQAAVLVDQCHVRNAQTSLPVSFVGCHTGPRDRFVRKPDSDRDRDDQQHKQEIRDNGTKQVRKKLHHD